MRSIKQLTGGLFLLLLANFTLQSQAAASGGNLLFYGLAGLALLIFFFIVVSVADNFMVIESNQSGINGEKANMGLYPRINELFSSKKPGFLDKEHVYTLRKGYDIPLEGAASTNVDTQTKATRFAIMPPDFVGLMPIPKVTVEVGDTVKAGDTVFYDKQLDRIKFAAPVSGEVIEIKRGLKRAIDAIVILADNNQVSRAYTVPAANASRSELVEFLLESGAWPGIRQRPYNVVADPDLVPRDIFVSTFDTAPLAADSALAIAGRKAAFQAGIDVLNRLTDGLVYLGLDGRGDTASPYASIVHAEKRYFRGPHPAGNVGVQIHHIHPAGVGADTVWTLDVNAVLTIGELFLHGRYTTQRVVALAGAELATPRHVATHAGANLGELLKGETLTNVRVLSGDVLTGSAVGTEGFLGFFDRQVTVLAEGDQPELFGWLLPLKARASISPTIPTFSKFAATTNTHGERRAFVVNNDYEQVMPMDIYTQQLMKAIMINDFEAMEGLGIYELVEEDVALAEFVCVSKQPLQTILRDGLTTMMQQG
ncbi:Na(+)-translocating NADH-quinone reductase subunit A [Neolewinella lacunae]|uniref:Na(+)-translocating NADH-quinone reductase subunit A n=1 Tax=Neolewinella lacunae TaxID=1517758 RepID=A0A923PS21_9BACT|nr:Na(+)-translocating NADH-quinone reductase subunit A [Neolewinella lacunae]MBC6995722.1 Na(+)-translocating NADH-quinone reductase subunit A [Neolewinella lacunae]MDN3636585.1 Na(+)-translocating NADH-quinone reductase subunit A [Neolewinella lacunae]